MSAAGGNPPVLLGRDIRKTFRRDTGEVVQALDDVSLEVGRGCSRPWSDPTARARRR